jgi:hypothetical protein
VALFAARAALREGAPPAALRERRAALERYRDTVEGRNFPGVEDTLAELARALGDAPAAAFHADAGRRERAAAAPAALERARAAFAAGRLDEAAGALDEMDRLAPGSPDALELRVRLALTRRDRRALEAAFAALRRAAPSLSEGVAAENRLRLALGLPLLPEEAPEVLAAAPAAP